MNIEEHWTVGALLREALEIVDPMLTKDIVYEVTEYMTVRGSFSSLVEATLYGDMICGTYKFHLFLKKKGDSTLYAKWYPDGRFIVSSQAIREAEGGD